jgi:uroporphyrin-III C-methyltransferase
MSTEIESLKSDLKSRRTGGGGSPMLVALAGLALLLAVYAHWRFGQFDDRDDRLRAQVIELRTAQARLESQLGTLATQLEQSNEQLRSQVRALREVPTQVNELGQSVAELRARTEAPQRAWVRAEALYLLELGARRLQLEHDVPTAIAAMESADARLATVTDPAVDEVRVQLGRELAALRAVSVPDLPAVIARLTTLEARAETFPVQGVPIASARRAEPSAAAEAPGVFERAGRRLAQAWRDLFSFRRVDPSTARLVTREEESLRRQHLELLLFAARIAAMQEDKTAYVQSLRAIDAWLERFFDTGSAEVAAARLEIADLGAVDIDPARPEVGTAAQLLQRVIRSSTPPS